MYIGTANADLFDPDQQFVIPDSGWLGNIPEFNLPRGNHDRLSHMNKGKVLLIYIFISLPVYLKPLMYHSKCF